MAVCVLSHRGLCVGLITRPEGCVVVCDGEASTVSSSRPTGGGEGAEVTWEKVELVTEIESECGQISV